MIPLAELLKVEPLTRGVVLTGSAHLSNMVSDVVVLAGPRIDGWLKVGQLVVTSGYPIEKSELTGSHLVRDLHAAGSAGVLYVPRWLGDAHLSEMLLTAKELGFPVIRIPPEVEFSEITRAVWSRLNYANADFGMLDLASEIGVGAYRVLDNLADTLSQMTGSEITIRDCDGAVVSHQKPGGVSSGCRDAEVTLPLEIDGSAVGSISMSGKNAPRPGEDISLEAVTRAISGYVRMLGSIRRMKSLHRRHCMWKLLFSPGSLKFPQDLEKAGIGVEDQVACIAIRGTIQVGEGDLPVDVTVEAFAPRSDEVVLAFLWSGETPLPAAVRTLNEVGERFSRAGGEGTPLRVGVSSVYTGVVHFQLALYEARSSIAPFINLANLVKKPAVSKDLIGQVEPGLARLYEYDQAHGTELVKTLREFYLCNCVMAETARRIYVHRRTLEYRLRRIEQITGLDIRSSRTRIKLEVCLELK